MTLSPGTRLGPYEILAPLGAGGMGEVYRARDARLNRSVAIKVLAVHLKDDADLRQRFLREAQAVAALEHPHICTLHDIGVESEMDFLVMECLEGETLAQRLATGALTVAQALQIAADVGSAIDHAHRHGIIHRDLKPGNIMLTKSGAKLLDFGLAKLLPGAPVALAGVTAATQGAHLTSQGSILGTLQYMAPEQLEGRDADARSDIFALGAVLYEMVTGVNPFSGTSPASVVAAILERDPPAISTVRPTAPVSLDRIVRRCVAKNPDDRWQSAGDLTFAIASVDAAASDVGELARNDGRARQATRLAIAGLILAGMVASFAWLAWPRSTVPSSPAPLRLLLTEPVQPRVADGPQRWFAISADGSRVVYAAESGGSRSLFVRELRSRQATPIADTSDAEFPFFSSDGQRIGFFANGTLKAVPSSGGPATTIANAGNSRGGTWAADGNSIIYAPSNDGGLWQVSLAGGSPRLVAQPDKTKGERSYRWPALLPGGDAVLFTITMSDIVSFDDARIAVRSLRTGEQHELVRGGMFPTYSTTGDLIYARAGALMAVAFDAKREAVTGPARAVLDDVVTSSFNGEAFYSLSATGTLLYAAGKPVAKSRSISWVDHSGRATRLSVEPAAYDAVRISPDGHKVALDIDGANVGVWILDLDRATVTRFTHEWNNMAWAWTPDGSRVTFQSGRGDGTRALYSKRIDGQDDARQIFPPAPFTFIGGASWTPDGRAVVFAASSEGTGSDLFVAERDGGSTPKPLVQTPFNEGAPALSPNGRWLAYVSNETGRAEVYVRAYPGPATKTRISTTGGTDPRWARNGRNLFYRSGDAMMAVAATSSASFSRGQPELLFRRASSYPYDISLDGRFLMIDDVPSDETRPQAVTVVLNWSEELKARGPTK